METLAEILAILRRQEAADIARAEYDSLGHRVIYDTVTGWSHNIGCMHVDPDCLDQHGHQVKHNAK